MHDMPLLNSLVVCLTMALVLGYITFRLKLSPIVGYLLAGVVVGPQTPGFVADRESATQFAEIGVVLLMFGVGLHFKLSDLLAVRRVALPGAIGQLTGATLLGMLAAVGAGWSWLAGGVIGVAVSVASTVVLIRVLGDNRVLDTEQGHIAVGWLIVEDLFTVLVLVLLPAMADALAGEADNWTAIVGSFALALVKISALGVIILGGGRRIIPRLLEIIARSRTRELFTLTILVLALTIAVGSSYIFGVSMALGAFLAGMVVGQSEVSHQAAADALPMRDAFAVLFFVSVGMLFEPSSIMAQPWLFIALLAVILIAKPLTAIAMVWFLGHSFRTALTVALGLAQIGEFSFILADLAAHKGLLPAEGQSLLVACAIVTISMNPLLFRTARPLENWCRRRPRLWRWLSERAERRLRVPDARLKLPESNGSDARRAIVVGYGPVGRTATKILRDFGVEPVIIDLNVETIHAIRRSGGLAIYGDASQREILHAADVENAAYLLITVPELETRTVIVIVAREMNPEIKVFVRARYLEERAWLEEIGTSEICFEEAEAAIGLATLLLHEVGADAQRVEQELQALRSQWAVHHDEPGEGEPAEASSSDDAAPPPGA